MYASCHPGVEFDPVVVRLIAAGACIDHANIDTGSDSPFTVACEAKRSAIAMLLVNAGATRYVDAETAEKHGLVNVAAAIRARTAAAAGVGAAGGGS